MILACKSWKNLTWKCYRLSTSPIRCSHCTLGNPKQSFSTVLFIHTYDYLCYLRKKTNCNPLAHPPENVTTLTCELQNFFIWLKVCTKAVTWVSLIYRMEPTTKNMGEVWFLVLGGTNSPFPPSLPLPIPLEVGPLPFRLPIPAPSLRSRPPEI